MTSAIPQGSNLATLFFILYINDIKSHIHNSDFLLFIDDLKIFIEVKNNSSITNLNNDLNNISIWAKNNNLKYNPSKCNAVLYSKTYKIDLNTIYIANSLISNISEVKDLGILYQSNFKFNKHIDNIIFKAQRKINYLKFFCKRFKNIKLLIILYNSMVKSNLMYGSIIWNPNKKGIVESIEKVQHLFLRFLSYKTNMHMRFDDHNYTPIMNFTKIKTLENSRAINDLKFIYKLLNKIIDCPQLLTKIDSFKPINPIRNPNNFFIIDNKLLFYSVIQRICYLCNLNKKWLKLKDLSLYQFVNLINKN